MPTALFLSPHLDDVAFSCGGTLLRLADDPNWRVVLCTIFAASVPDPQGFALRCQTDKGIPPEVDYMALRREEDRVYAAMSGVDDVRHWAFREAPHRGYDSPVALFAGARGDDAVWQPIGEGLAALKAELDPAVVFAPQGLGNHVDHLQTIRAVLDVFPAEGVGWYRDTPYAIREPGTVPSALLPGRTGLGEGAQTSTRGACAPQQPRDGSTLQSDGRDAHTPGLMLRQVHLSPQVLERKIAGCCRYASQIGFQFGGPDGVREKLTAFHRREAGGGAASPTYAETFLAHPDLRRYLPT